MSTRPATATEPVPQTPTKEHAQGAPTSASLRRVHFSPCNEEIPEGVLPHSSPTRARMRPRSRGILKRHSGAAQTDQLPSSDIDLAAGADPLGAQLSSPLHAAVGNGGIERLAGGRLLFADEAAAASNVPFEEAFAQTVAGLQHAAGGDDALPRLYNGLCGLIAKNAQQAGAAAELALGLLDCIQRDIADPATPKQTALAATKCLGCALHIEGIGAAAAAADRLCGPLEAMAGMVQRQAAPDKGVCQAAVWCAGMVRAPAAALKPAVAGLVQLCVAVMARFGTSTTAQFECLAALEALLRRAPGATRQAYRLWLFPVLDLVASPIAGVRAKAGGIMRQNIPWVAADAHGPDMDGPVRDFLATRLDPMLAAAARLLGHGEHVLVARIWGLVIAVCARHCRGRLNDLLRVIQECFNSPSAEVLIAALMQWRCVIYAFVLESRLHLHKCVQLVLTPITKILEMPGADVDVRLACVRCWATLVYALGEEIGSHIDIIARVVALVADDARADVRAVVARVLASLFNKFALAESSVAQFVIPRMVIGTTTLAASDGKSLSDTHGPFSSESSYGADHTVVLCKYVTGLGASSPTVPVVADTAVKFIHRYLLAERRAAEDCGPSADPQDPQRRHRSFAGLCKALAAAIAALAATQQRQLTTAITRVFVSTLAPPGARDLALDSGYVCGYDRSPHALLYVALVDGLGDGLRLARLDAPELLLGKECDPAGAAADPARAALLPPDRAFAPTCLGALACRHALWMGLQARALASCGPEDRRDVVVEAAARLVRELLPGEPELRAGREGTADDALAAVAMGSLLDIEGLPHAVQSALAQMFDRATAAMRASPPSPHTPLVLSAALFSGTGPGAPDLLKARERAVSCLGAAAADSGGFWQGVFHLLADRVLDDPRPLGACEPRLVAALCSGCEPKAHGSQDAAYCLGLATVAFGLAFGAPAADAGEAIRELARAVRRELDGAATGSPQQLLSRVLLPLVRDAAERVVSSHAGEDVDAARRSMAAFVASAVRGSAADPESESAREVVAAAERLLRARSVRRAAEDVAAAEPSLPLPLECAQPAVAPDTPAGETPADPRGIRKHKQSPVSSDQDDDSGDDDDGRAAAAELAQTPQRRRRKKRAKRRAPVSRASSPSGPEDAAPDRLLEAVDHLEAALQAAAPCSVRRLLAVQARISDVQQRLCEAMRQGLEPARDG